MLHSTGQVESHKRKHEKREDLEGVKPSVQGQLGISNATGTYDIPLSPINEDLPCPIGQNECQNSSTENTIKNSSSPCQGSDDNLESLSEKGIDEEIKSGPNESEIPPQQQIDKYIIVIYSTFS